MEPEGTKRIHLQERLRACPACQYRDGFHVSFLQEEGVEGHRLILICPQCSATFDVGWLIAVEE